MDLDGEHLIWENDNGNDDNDGHDDDNDGRQNNNNNRSVSGSRWGTDDAVAISYSVEEVD